MKEREEEKKMQRNYEYDSNRVTEREKVKMRPGLMSFGV